MKLGIKFDKERCLPLILTGIIILVDQCSKAFIAAKWPINSMIVDVFNKDPSVDGLLQIIHVRNKAIAFSLGVGIPDTIKPALFVILPLLVLGVLLWYYLSSNDFSRIQRWAVAGILGGGIGNIIDRIFRSEGVVDFISVKLYGLFGWERWPTFNAADSSVVVCCILLFITIIIDSINKKPEAAQ
jgi:signal peptidase II